MDKAQIHAGVQVAAVELLTPCFDDWKRFCFVLRQIAYGGRAAAPGFAAHRRTQAILKNTIMHGGALRQTTVTSAEDERIARGSSRVR
jgi:hypothetical protein